MALDPDSLSNDVLMALNEPDSLLYISAESVKELIVAYKKKRLGTKDKRFLMGYIAQEVAEDEAEEAANSKISDEEFFKEFFALPYDNPMTAEEAKLLIRDSRHSGVTRHIKPLSDYAE